MVTILTGSRKGHGVCGRETSAKSLKTFYASKKEQIWETPFPIFVKGLIKSAPMKPVENAIRRPTRKGHGVCGRETSALCCIHL
jgi:hypothetical protein